jgi:AhpD family alkylhydroperoxidase
MEPQILKARIFTPSVFYKHVKTVVRNFSDILKSRKSGHVSKAFSEKIMLAVTQVNGCRLCNYLHTKNAIDAGASEEEIRAMVNGELGDVGNDESLALLFAQHYADQGGDFDTLTYRKFVTHYGEEKARDILASIRIIMVGNIHGISIDALQSRLRGKKMQGSKFSSEIGIFLGIFIMIPVAILQVWIEKLIGKKPNPKKKSSPEMVFGTLKIK